MIKRRNLIAGCAAVLFAPAIVRISSLMPLSVQPIEPVGYMEIYIGGVHHRIPVLSIDVTRDELSRQLADALNQRTPPGIIAEVKGEVVNLFARSPDAFSQLWAVT
jgi:hypothetical protein